MAVSKEEILKLAKLARISVPESEIDKLREDIGAILAYVAKINDAEASGRPDGGGIHDNHIVRSVLREDGPSHEPGLYTEELLSAAPARENNYFKVKKILNPGH